LTFEYPGGERAYGKYTKLGSRYRVEATPPELGEYIVWILHRGDPAIWLYPKRKQYREGGVPFLAAILAPMVFFDQLADDEATVLHSLGHQTVAGHPCEKVEITAKGKEGLGTVLYAAIDLGGQIIKIDYGQLLLTQFSGTPKRVWIKTLAQKPRPESFELPDGFTKIIIK
jgi:hypothetical protein